MEKTRQRIVLIERDHNKPGRIIAVPHERHMGDPPAIPTVKFINCTDIADLTIKFESDQAVEGGPDHPFPGHSDVLVLGLLDPNKAETYVYQIEVGDADVGPRPGPFVTIP
jgi:hypothetical protein